MPNARVVFDDNVQVISPVAEAMARLGKTLAYDIPKMQMEREQMEYARQSHAASSAAAAENRDYSRNRDAQQDAASAENMAYNRNRDVQQDARQVRLDNVAADKVIYDRNQDVLSANAAVKKDKETKAGAVHIMPAGLRDAINDNAARNAVKGKYGVLIDGKLHYEANDPDAAQKHQADIDRMMIEAGFNPRNLLPLSPEEQRSALDALGSQSGAAPATAPSTDAPSLQMEDATNARRDAWRAKTDTFMADPANASFRDDRVMGMRPDVFGDTSGVDVNVGGQQARSSEVANSANQARQQDPVEIAKAQRIREFQGKKSQVISDAAEKSDPAYQQLMSNIRATYPGIVGEDEDAMRSDIARMRTEHPEWYRAHRAYVAEFRRQSVSQ